MAAWSTMEDERIRLMSGGKALVARIVKDGPADTDYRIQVKDSRQENENELFIAQGQKPGTWVQFQTAGGSAVVFA